MLTGARERESSRREADSGSWFVSAARGPRCEASLRLTPERPTLSSQVSAFTPRRSHVFPIVEKVLCIIFGSEATAKSDSNVMKVV